MKTLLASLVCSTAFLLSGTARAHDLNAMLQQALADKSVPAMAILVIRDGKIDAQAQAGVRANDGHDAVRADDVWNIGSDGKAMTVTLIARLVERGVLSWDAPLSNMLPALAGGMRAAYPPRLPAARRLFCAAARHFQGVYRHLSQRRGHAQP